MTPDAMQRIQALEAAAKQKPRAAPAQSASSSGFWNWSVESLASGSNGQAEVGIDLSGSIGRGAREVLLYAQIDYPDAGGVSSPESCEINVHMPDLATQITLLRLFADDQTGLGGQAVIPLSGTGFRYTVDTDPASPSGQFDWSLKLLAWR